MYIIMTGDTDDTSDDNKADDGCCHGNDCYYDT